MNVKKLKSAIAIAALSTFSAGAYAGGNAMSVEVRTPSSVSESAPWLTGQPHLRSDAGGADNQVAIVEYWLIGAPGEESSASAGELIVLDIEPSAVDASLQPAPSADIYILTPMYEQG